MSSLHRAIRKNDLSLVAHILNVTPTILETRDVDGKTPLYIAVTRNNIAITLLLLQKGADPNTDSFRGDYDLIPLDGCCRSEIAKLLIDFGSSAGSHTNYGSQQLYEGHKRTKELITSLLLFSVTPVARANRNVIRSIAYHLWTLRWENTRL